SRPATTIAHAVAWRPDGEQLAASTGDQVHIWAKDSEEPVLGLTDLHAPAGGIAWSPDGKWIAATRNHTNGPGKACLWNAATGKLQWTFEEPPPRRHSNWFGSPAFTPDGKKILLHGAVTRFLDVQTGEAEPYLKEVEAGYSVALSPDGTRFAGGGYYAHFRRHESATGRRLHEFRHAHGMGVAVSFTPDGRHIASGNPDHTLRLWDAETARMQWMTLLLPNGKGAVFTEAGQLKTQDPDVDQHLVYLVEQPNGSLDVLTPAEFRSCIVEAFATKPPTIETSQLAFPSD
ncbi:MAG: WD40 repeat domain-containing protein, partial [Planctomycetia bacterium]|nr:WD40 repeat domain-containing protein [Planctomycetia bacterium]